MNKITGYAMEAETLEVFRWRGLNFCFVQIESVGKSYRAILNYESGYPITPTGIGLSYMSTRTKAQTAIAKAVCFLEEKYSADLSMLNAKQNIKIKRENTELDDNYFIENNFINKKKNKKTKKIG